MFPYVPQHFLGDNLGLYHGFTIWVYHGKTHGFTKPSCCFSAAESPSATGASAARAEAGPSAGLRISGDVVMGSPER